MSSANRKKRRKVSDDDTSTTPSVIPSAVVSSSGGNGGISTSVEPKLDEIPKLVLVELQKDDADDVEKALESLDGLLNPGDENIDAKKNLKFAIQAGAPPIVILTLKKWLMHEKIQGWGCGCLSRLLYICESDTALSVIHSGGIEAVVTSLNNFPNSNNVQYVAFSVIQNIADFLDEEAAIKEPLRRFIDEMDGLKLIQKSMKKFANDLDIQRTCCGLLEDMAQAKDFHTPLLKLGVEAVAIALKNHSDDEEVLKAAKGFMKRISADNDEDDE